MAAATDQQVQRWSDERSRVRSEAIRALVVAFTDDNGAFGDIFDALTQPLPTWHDNRIDGPPHLLVPNDLLAINTFQVDILAAIKGHAQYPILLKACVRAA